MRNSIASQNPKRKFNDDHGVLGKDMSERERKRKSDEQEKWEDEETNTSVRLVQVDDVCDGVENVNAPAGRSCPRQSSRSPACLSRRGKTMDRYDRKRNEQTKHHTIPFPWLYGLLGKAVGFDKLLDSREKHFTHAKQEVANLFRQAQRTQFNSRRKLLLLGMTEMSHTLNPSLASLYPLWEKPPLENYETRMVRTHTILSPTYPLMVQHQKGSDRNSRSSR
jgi:hypothetical protein